MNLLHRIASISLLILFASACQPGNNQSDNDQPEMSGQTEMSSQTESSIGMLQHTVFFYMNDDVTEEEREQFEEGLIKLLEIPEVYRSETGIPAGTEERDVTDHSYAYSIYTWFETMEDYNVYAEHPDHLEFIDTYNHLWSDVKVYDADIFDVR